jgi:hypothetical protein
MKLVIIIILIPIFLMAGSLVAETSSNSPKEQIPPGPLIQKKAPQMFEWEVMTYLPGNLPDEKKSGDQSLPKLTPAKTSIVKTMNIYKVTSVDFQGRAETIWSDGKKSAHETSFGAERIVKPASSFDRGGYCDFSSGDFEGFDWISTNNFTGIKDFKGRKCLVFTEVLRNKEYLVISANTNIAYIDLETRFPVMKTDNDLTIIFNYLNPPSGELSVPPKVRQIFDEDKKNFKKSSIPPIAPF